MIALSIRQPWAWHILHSGKDIENRDWPTKFRGRVLAETEVKERFTDHDIRRKAGSEQESLEAARRLLGHVDPRTTNRHYRTKPEVT